MFGRKQKAELCKKIASLYRQILDEEDASFRKIVPTPSRRYHESLARAQENSPAFHYDILSNSPRLYFVRKSSLEKTIMNLQHRLEALKRNP